MTPLERSERAKQLMADEVLQAMFRDVRMSFVEQLESLPMSDVESQHEAALSLQLLKSLWTQLERYSVGAAVDKHKARQASYVERIREKFRA